MGFKLYLYIYQNKNGPACYTLTTYLAKRLLDKTKNFGLVDCYFWSRRFICPNQVEPALAVQDIFLNKHNLTGSHHWKIIGNGSFFTNKLIRLKLSLYTLPRYFKGLFFAKKGLLNLTQKILNKKIKA